MGHDVRIKVVFDYECPLLEPRILTNPHMIQTGHIWFFQLAVCFWVLGLPLFYLSDFRGWNYSPPHPPSFSRCNPRTKTAHICTIFASILSFVGGGFQLRGHVCFGKFGRENKEISNFLSKKKSGF